MGRAVADAMTATRSGLGFDLHPLVEGRPLILGGITIPGEKGLGGRLGCRCADPRRVWLSWERSLSETSAACFPTAIRAGRVCRAWFCSKV